MKLITIVLASLLIMASATVVLAAQGGLHATAVLKDVKGNEVGVGQFTQDEKGLVRVNVSVKGLPPGDHGIHIHEKGNCSPTFAAAGGHYNPMHRQHGLNNPNGPHAGDLPDLTVNKDGTGYLSTTTDRVTLSPGPATLFTKNGTALVIHAKSDDQRTNPSGNSGDRIACGPIVKDR